MASSSSFVGRSAKPKFTAIEETRAASAINASSRCCQTNRNSSPFGWARAGESELHAASDCHTARADERFCL